MSSALISKYFEYFIPLQSNDSDSVGTVVNKLWYVCLDKALRVLNVSIINEKTTFSLLTYVEMYWVCAFNKT